MYRTDQPVAFEEEMHQSIAALSSRFSQDITRLESELKNMQRQYENFGFRLDGEKVKV